MYFQFFLYYLYTVFTVLCNSVRDATENFVKIANVTVISLAAQSLDICTLCSKKLVHQADIDNFVNSQWISKILSLAHCVENLPRLGAHLCLLALSRQSAANSSVTWAVGHTSPIHFCYLPGS